MSIMHCASVCSDACMFLVLLRNDICIVSHMSVLQQLCFHEKRTMDLSLSSTTTLGKGRSYVSGFTFSFVSFVRLRLFHSGH